MELVGKVLAAPPANQDEFFQQSVIYVYDQTHEGTVGLCLNRPSDRTIQELAEHHGLRYNGKEPLYVGGPVNPHALVMLHSPDWYCSNTMEVNGSFRVSSDKSMLARICQGDCPKYWRFFLGMSGWKTGQLEGEIRGEKPWSRAHSWLIGPASEKILFNKDHTKVWDLALKSSGREMIDTFFSIH